MNTVSCIFNILIINPYSSQVVPGTLFIVVEHGPKKSSNSNQKSGTRTSSGPKSPFSRGEKPEVRTPTAFPLCPITEEGANPDMVVVGVV